MRDDFIESCGEVPTNMTIGGTRNDGPQNLGSTTANVHSSCNYDGDNDDDDNIDQLDTLWANFRQTIPIANDGKYAIRDANNMWLLETWDLLRFLKTLNTQFDNYYNAKETHRHQHDDHLLAQKSRRRMTSQIELAYSMLAKAERTCPYSLPLTVQPSSPPPPRSRPVNDRHERSQAEEGTLHLDPKVLQNMNTLLLAIRNYADETFAKFQRWLDRLPSAASTSPWEGQDLIYNIFLAPKNDTEEDDEEDEPLDQASAIVAENDGSDDPIIGSDMSSRGTTSIPNSPSHKLRHPPATTTPSHPPTYRTPHASTKDDNILDPVKFQKQQQKLLEEELASMTSRLKSTTLAMNATLQSQTKELDSMEQLAQSNLEQVTNTTKDVEGRLAKKRGWKKQLATWSLIGTVVGMWVLCFMVMRTVPKRTLGKFQLLGKKGSGDGDEEERWSFGNGAWRVYFSKVADIISSSSRLDHERILKDGEKESQEQEQPQLDQCVDVEQREQESIWN